MRLQEFTSVILTGDFCCRSVHCSLMAASLGVPTGLWLGTFLQKLKLVDPLAW